MECNNLDVIVLTYNRAEYLRIMLESLCTQTATGFNIKVLNNCSTDNTIEVVKEIQEKYPERNIQIITNAKNLGNPGNFKKSQEVADNEYVAIFHDDDAVHPEYLETAMSLFKKHKDAVMCCCGSDVKYNINNNNWDILEKNYFYYPCKDNAYYQLLCSRPNFATDVYKTSAYKKAHYRPELYGKLHDICFILDICQLGGIINLCGYGLRYRIHSGSDSQNYKTGPFDYEVKNVIGYLKTLIQNHFLSKPLLWNFMFFLYKWSKINEYMPWENFINDMNVNLEVQSEGGELFNKFDKILLKNKFFIDMLNKLIFKRAQFYRRKLYNKYDK